MILAKEDTPLSLLPVVLEWVKYRLTPSNRVFGALGIILWEFGKDTFSCILTMPLFSNECVRSTPHWMPLLSKKEAGLNRAYITATVASQLFLLVIPRMECVVMPESIKFVRSPPNAYYK